MAPESFTELFQRPYQLPTHAGMDALALVAQIQVGTKLPGNIETQRPDNHGG